MKKFMIVLVAAAASLGPIAAAQAESIVQKHPAGMVQKGGETVPTYTNEEHPINSRVPVGTAVVGGETVPVYGNEVEPVKTMGVDGHTDAMGNSHIKGK